VQKLTLGVNKDRQSAIHIYQTYLLNLFISYRPPLRCSYFVGRSVVVALKLRKNYAKTTFFKLKNFLLACSLPLALRLREVKYYIWPILLYGAETWPLTAGTLNGIEAFEMWTHRRLLRVPWIAHAINEEILRTACYEREILSIVKERKVSYIDHIFRGGKYHIPTLILQGKI